MIRCSLAREHLQDLRRQSREHAEAMAGLLGDITSRSAQTEELMTQCQTHDRERQEEEEQRREREAEEARQALRRMEEQKRADEEQEKMAEEKRRNEGGFDQLDDLGSDPVFQRGTSRQSMGLRR